jgi:hypothetical protein
MIVEDGTGISTANSYLTVQEADDYFTTYGNTNWDAVTADKELALIQATQSIDLLYGEKYISYKAIEAPGALLWPRQWCYDNNQQLITDSTIPVTLKRAVSELALMSLMGEDIIPLENDENGVKLSRIQIDVIEIETQYANEKKVSETFTGFRKIDLLLSAILVKKTKTSITLKR